MGLLEYVFKQIKHNNSLFDVNLLMPNDSLNLIEQDNKVTTRFQFY